MSKLKSIIDNKHELTVAIHLTWVITMSEYGYQNFILDVGLKISYYRKRAGLTQEDLAERVGVSTSYIGMIEAPGVSKSTSLKTLYAIATALGVPPYKLLQND